jgi:hypothetical protein
MVEVGLDGIGGHDRARGIVDALAQHLGVIGEDLKELGGRIAVAGLEGQAAFGHLVAHLRGGIGRIVSKSRASMMSGAGRREIDSGEGSIGPWPGWPALGWRAGHMPGWLGAGLRPAVFSHRCVHAIRGFRAKFQRLSRKVRSPLVSAT